MRQTPPLYFNSHLTRPVLQARLQPPRFLRSSPSERFSPPVRPTQVSFSPCLSEAVLGSASLSPEKSVLDVKSGLGAGTVHESFRSLRPILKKPQIGLKVKVDGRLLSTSASPTKSADYAAKPVVSAFDDIDRMVRDLSPNHLRGLRHIIARCRAKTRAFYQEMHRQACLSAEELSKEQEHAAYFQRVIGERRHARRRTIQAR